VKSRAAAALATAALPAGTGHWRRWVRSRRWGKLTLESGLVMLFLVIAMSLFGQFYYGDASEQDLFNVMQPPSFRHPFGTDDLGRNLFARTLSATWIDLSVAAGVTLLSVVLGVTLGSVAGYFRGWPERLITRVVDVVIAFPFMITVIAIVVIIGPGIPGVFLGLTVGGIASYARMARAEMLVLTERAFVHAAQTLGYSRSRIIFRHAIPNLIRPSVVYSMSDVVGNLVWLASLSYLGLGVQPPTPEWGSIIGDGQPHLLTAWWLTTLPGLVLIFVAIAFSLIGDGLADRFRIRREILP
jgi:peptide/nickel transport system permease protein